MGSGVPSFPWPPRNLYEYIEREEGNLCFEYKTHGLLVLVSSTHRCASTSSLSTSSSTTALQCLAAGRTHLEAGFPLRCFQRLSIPHMATLLCRWRDNRSTSGAFIPVLSY